MANKRHSKGKMYALIRKWEQSGLSQAKFFSEHKISKSTFGYWRKKYLREQVQIKTQGKMVPIHILAPDAGLVAIYETINGKDSPIYFIHKDYLGSIQYISNEQGQVVETLSFDPWGNRRNPNDWSIDYDPQEPLFDRGFTGHQHLDDFHLINMNGRVYDPILAQFLSPDNYVSAPESSQGLNRYIYCYNNPLVYTDPDGQVPWLALGIVAAYTYLSNAHANRDPETGKWAWNPATWFGSNSNTTITAGISTNGNSVTGYGGIGTGNNFPVFGYNNQNGAGVGLWSPEGTTGFYYPNIDYDAGAKAVDPMINNVRNEYFSQVNGLNNFYIDTAPDWVLDAISYTIPAAISVEVAGSAEVVPGATSATPWGGILILRGPDAWSYSNFASAGLGGGWIGSNAMIQGYHYHYVGDIDNFNMQIFEDWGTNNICISGNAGLTVGRNISWLENPSVPGEFLIGTGPAVGIGISPTIISGQYTFQFNRLY